MSDEELGRAITDHIDRRVERQSLADVTAVLNEYRARAEEACALLREAATGEWAPGDPWYKRVRRFLDQTNP